MLANSAVFLVPHTGTSARFSVQLLSPFRIRSHERGTHLSELGIAMTVTKETIPLEGTPRADVSPEGSAACHVRRRVLATHVLFLLTLRDRRQ